MRLMIGTDGPVKLSRLRCQRAYQLRDNVHRETVRPTPAAGFPEPTHCQRAIELQPGPFRVADRQTELMTWLDVS